MEDCTQPDEHHVWARARLVRLSLDGFECADCAASDFERTLEVHHLVPLPDKSWYSRPGCWHHPEGLITVCTRHHKLRHARLRRWERQCLDAAPGVQLVLALAA